ncbi:hypothetical protein FXO37_04473 [Capsicum annuum]|nr:hypothetical protein FXO37_04473 [Capsicum annuum]
MDRNNENGEEPDPNDVKDDEQVDEMDIVPIVKDKEKGDDYSSTILESAQSELDAIMKRLEALVDDLPLEVVKPIEEMVNQHFIFDSQMPPDFPNAVVAVQKAAKPPANRTRTKSKIFMSPYLTDHASGSKAIQDEITEIKQKFTFDGFIISDDMSRGVIKEYKQWVEEGLLKLHGKKDCRVFVAGYEEYLSKGMDVPSVDFEAEYHHMRYTSLLRNYGLRKAKKYYVSDNDDPPRPRTKILPSPDASGIVSIT